MILKYLSMYLAVLGFIGTWAGAKASDYNPSAAASSFRRAGTILVLEPFYIMSGQGKQAGLERVIVKIEDYGSLNLTPVQANPSQLRGLIYEILSSGKTDGELQKELVAKLGGTSQGEGMVTVELTRSRLLCH